MLKPVTSDSFFNLDLNEREFTVLICALLVLQLKDLFDRKDKWLTKLHNQIFVLRWITYLVIALSIIYYGVYGSDSGSEFIYFQF